jgi:hypothetical protein
MNEAHQSVNPSHQHHPAPAIDRDGRGPDRYPRRCWRQPLNIATVRWAARSGPVASRDIVACDDWKSDVRPSELKAGQWPSDTRIATAYHQQLLRYRIGDG